MRKSNLFIRNILIVIISFTVFFTSCSRDNKVVSEPNIIPKPVKTELLSGVFSISADTKICSDDALKDIGSIFSDQLEVLSNLKLDVSNDCKSGKNIILQIDKNITEDDGYKLEISSDKVVVSGKDMGGVYYGT
ncbi:MAG: hypothetical protein KAG37_00380, partial [Flavobacteriales bacterium]|nr:hypothetical protein [Flavobacteriales bacterium]